MNSSATPAYSVSSSNAAPTSGFTNAALLSTLARSTFAGITLFAAASAFIDTTAAPTCPESIHATMGEQSRIGAMLAAYDARKLDFQKVKQLFSASDEFVLPFLSWLPLAVSEVYGHGTKMSLRSLDDPDTGEPILEACIYSGIPVGDEFDMKDAELFAKIEKSTVVDGMRHVIVAQG
ncbi:MAG: hypothetical protein IPP85_15655 [Propionivibrio sp.]|nr:hypothetical protein [Propionivibrio sp.]